MKLNKEQKKHISTTLLQIGVAIYFILIIAEPVLNRNLTIWHYLGFGLLAFVSLVLSVWILGDKASKND